MQKSGFLNSLSLTSFGSLEKSIVRERLSKVWFITFTRQEHYKSSEHSFVFGKPTDDLIEAFHFNREVLILFSPHGYFDSRSLDFVDTTINKYRNRLDKLCVILISKDPSVQKKIRDISFQDKESRIVVPFTYDDLLGTPLNETEDFIARRLRSFFYERDLFAYDSPLRT